VKNQVIAAAIKAHVLPAATNHAVINRVATREADNHGVHAKAMPAADNATPVHVVVRVRPNPAHNLPDKAPQHNQPGAMQVDKVEATREVAPIHVLTIEVVAMTLDHPLGRGGSGRDNRGGQRGGRRDDRDDGPTSYTTRVPRSDTPATPISEAMAKGDEPLRSFGDLMQFFKKAQPEPVVKPKVVEVEAPIAEAPAPPASEPVQSSERTSAPTSDADGENPAT
jgi:hypothetical protein